MLPATRMYSCSLWSFESALASEEATSSQNPKALITARVAPGTSAQRSKIATRGTFQAKTKVSQIRQNPAKPGQKRSKEKAWISLDSLGRIEPFQGLAPTPQGVFSLSAAGPF